MNMIIGLTFLLLTFQSIASANADKLVFQAKERLNHNITYDGRYIAIDYPNGDVPSNIGVCTDVIIRSYRGIGIDLQKLVHEDIKTHFSQYPSKRIWGLSRPDKNIDHRRVPNLQTFFKRNGESLSISTDGADYLAGDVVSWILPGNLPHIGIVSDETSSTSGLPLIVHNIGSGPKMEDVLFTYTITGHYRFLTEVSGG